MRPLRQQTVVLAQHPFNLRSDLRKRIQPRPPRVPHLDADGERASRAYLRAVRSVIPAFAAGDADLPGIPFRGGLFAAKLPLRARLKPPSHCASTLANLRVGNRMRSVLLIRRVPAVVAPKVGNLRFSPYNSRIQSQTLKSWAGFRCFLPATGYR